MSMCEILVCILIALFQSIAAFSLIFKQIRIKYNIKNKIIFLGIMWIYCIVSFYLIPNQIRFILCIIVMFCIMTFILKIKDEKNIIYCFNVEIILAISEIIVTLILVLIGFDSKDIVLNPFYNLFANIFISLLAITLVNIKFIQIVLDKIINLFDKNKKFIKYLYIFVIIIYLISLKNGLELILKSNYYINVNLNVKCNKMH